MEHPVQPSGRTRSGHEIEVVLANEGDPADRPPNHVHWIEPMWLARCRCGWASRLSRSTRSEARRDGRLHLESS